MGIVKGKKRAKEPVPEGYVGVDDVKLRGFELVEHMPKSSYRDNSMCIIAPLRTPMVHHKVVQAWQALQYPMNQRRAFFMVSGAEVGDAYQNQVEGILAHPELSKWKYILTLEDDNVPPPDAIQLLLEAIDAGPFDAVGGLYFLKGDFAMPQCYGSAEEYARSGAMDMRPRDIVGAIKQGAIVPCLGIAMGCSLYRMQMFRDVPAPWFVSNAGSTQDLHFCQKAVPLGKRFAVDTRCRVGHIDVTTGITY